jgi:hypothetical protein
MKTRFSNLSDNQHGDHRLPHSHDLDLAYDAYEMLEEEALTRLREADSMSEGTTDTEDSISVDS